MISFASLFNQFRGSSNNAVNDLLEQNDVTLAKLLDQDSFINEFKAGNSKLLDFMKYSKVKELVDYITVVGPPEDKKRSYKYPQTAAQVLSSDLNTVQEFFLPSGKIYEDIITYEQQMIETEISPQDQEQEQNSKSQTDKQKTIISDTLQPAQQEQLANQAESQNLTSPELQQSSTNKSNKQVKAEENIEKPTDKKPKIKVQKLQQVQKIQKVQVEPLIYHLFKYFDQQINYILTGYVCKVLTALFTKKGKQMMEFLFTDKKVYKMVKHIESRSVGQFLLKVLTFESNLFVKERALFFANLLIRLAEDNSVHVLSNFSAFISETIEKAAANVKSTSPVPEFTLVFFLPQVVTLVIKNVMSDFQNVSVYNAPILLTYLTNVPFTLPQDQNIINQFKKLLDLFFQKSLQKLTVSSKDRPKLGFGRIKIIQIFNYILRENVLNARQIFASKPNAFKTLFNLCKSYQMNNVLHNQVVKTVSLALSDEKLSKSLVENDVLLNFLLTQAEQDLKIRKGENFQKYRKGYIGHVVLMARQIQEFASKGAEGALKILDRDEFDRVLNILVEKQMSQANKNLGGFSLRKDLKNEIQFQKQHIITRYIDFLAHSPKPVFEAQPEPINIEHPDFLEQMQRQIEESLSLEEASRNQAANQVNQKVQTESQTPPQPQLSIEVHFFKGHLDYDLDHLMKDL